MRLLSFTLLILVFFSCNTKEEKQVYNDPLQRELNGEEARDDLRLFKNILDKAHPSVNEFISKDRWEHVYDSIYSSIDNGISFRDFYKKLYFLLNEIGCCHSMLEMPDSTGDLLYARELFFPMPVILLEDGLYTNSDDVLPTGCKLISINNLKVEKILDSITTYNSIDGNHRETQRYIAATTFGFDYFTHFGSSPDYDVVYIDTAGVRKVKVVKPVDLTELNSRQRNKYYFDATDVPYSMNIEEEYNLATIRVSTFDLDSYNQRKAYSDFLSNSFELLKLKPNIKNLVIDLRENSGGKLMCSYQLFSYIADKPFKEYASVSSRIRKVPYTSLISADASSDVEYNINDYLKTDFLDIKTDVCCIPDSLIADWEPEDSRFTGKVFVITNAGVASSASCFTSLIKNNNRGVVVGTETGGGRYAGNGFEHLEYTLPHTKISVQFPFARLNYIKDSLHDGHGIIPDYKVPDNLEFFKTNSDRQLIFIKDTLISKKG